MYKFKRRTSVGHMVYNVFINILWEELRMEDKKKLSADKKINYILTLQNQGLTRKEIAKKMEYTRLDTLDRFMKKQGYNRTNDIYELEEDNWRTNIHDDSAYSIVIPEVMEDNSPTTGIYDKEIQKKLLSMVNNYDSFINVINWFNNGGHMEDISPVIEVNTGLQMDFSKSETIKTTIRVDKEIWESFSEVCKFKYAHLNKHDLISKAFLDFIQNYNK